MRNFIFLIGTLILCSCNQTQVSETAILITDTNVLNVRNGAIVEHRYVVVDSGKIKSISEAVENQNAYKTVIDGTDKFLMPGLAEMHAHIPQPSTRNPEIVDETLFLYLSNGITTIRGMLGHPSHLELREKALNNEILSPRIYTSSPSLNGNTISTKEEAVEKVTQYQKEGYDFLKIHPGIQLDVFDTAVETANKVGIPFAGHVPVDVGVRHAMESGYASIDHVDGFLEGLVPQSANVDPNANGFFGYAFTPLADVKYMDELVDMAKENEVWIVSTQSLYERWFAPISGEELSKQPEMKYMAASTLKNWITRKAQLTETDDFDVEQWQQFNTIRRQLMRKLQNKGHGMLLGSDAPQLFNVPGFSIHHEIDGMRRAGLTPLQIIQSGTINPAKYFNEEGTYGEVRVGVDADLILLNANPLQDLKALKDFTGVMVRGQWLSKESIDARLTEIAKANTSK
ncbi:amidohydrolase family protein [Winogradskyella immobilis]|uniref:Amidohydrolase family protein n=1 Tax=Winogradskyella immobilis TaxID=2816852 RepID=A0ABS8EL33_9FLAO|nr:amidohydrolase family protein [Winogradskyella immobilis]MCC1483916.1 amidohydrolase family protein [Winogradskyella immobilis]MCG0016009.1 amidohydrolase family protein [Winogradskyella immobilis]